MANRRHLYLLNTLIGALVVQHSDWIVSEGKSEKLKEDFATIPDAVLLCFGGVIIVWLCLNGSMYYMLCWQVWKVKSLRKMANFILMFKIKIEKWQ